MPTYTITDPASGKKVKLSGDSPPTEAELSEIFSKVHSSALAGPSATAQPARTWGDTAADVAIGAAKGVGNTVFGLGKVVHDYTPIGRISDAIQPGAFDQRPPEIVPSNTAQRVGFTGEQLAEFFVPAGTAAKAGKLVNVAKDAGLALAQSGSPAAAGLSGALTAAMPGGKMLSKASEALESSAQKTMADALRASKEWAKAESEKLAPEMLKRGIGGTFKGMRTQAREMAARVGQNLDDAYKAAAAAGETVPSDIVRGNIQLSSDALHITSASGKKLAVPGREEAIAKLSELETFIGEMGADIPVDKAVTIKRAWDEIVSKAGLYGNKATAPASEKAAAWSFREAANSFRELLNANPDIAALNKEAGFWIGMRDVLNATKLRKVGQTGGLMRAGGSMVGATVGGMTGDSYSERAVNGVIGGLAGQQFIKLVQSPYFMTKVSAPAKQALADALASGNAGQIRSVTSRIVSALPAQAR